MSADANIKTLNLHEGLISQAFLHFLRRPLPAFLKTLAYVDYTGRLHWEEGGINRVAGTLKTAVGSVEGRLAFNGHYEGNLKVKALRPTIIAQNQDLPDQLYATLSGSMARATSAYGERPCGRLKRNGAGSLTWGKLGSDTLGSRRETIEPGKFELDPLFWRFLILRPRQDGGR